MVKVIRKIVVPAGLAQQNGYSVPPYTSVHAHDTGNPNSSMQNEHDYLAGHYSDAFYTHLVGWNPSTKQAEAWQVAEKNQGAWDLGSYNGNANGYASVEFVGGSINNQSQFNSAYKLYVELLRQLADEAGAKKVLDPQESIKTAGAGYIITHNFASLNGFGSSHVDPIAFLAKWGVSYDKLKRDIKNGLGATKTTTTKIKHTAPVPKSDVDKFRAYGKVNWNHKNFKANLVEKRNGIWQAISYELSANGKVNYNWTNNGVPLSVVTRTNNKDQSHFNAGDTFKFDKNIMPIVAYDNASNGIKVRPAGNGSLDFWVDATVAWKA